MFCIIGHVNTVHIGVPKEIGGYRYSGYWEYWRSIRPFGLKCGVVYMVTSLHLILEFQRKFGGTDPVDIENINV
jgi:hypothetical protein